MAAIVGWQSQIGDDQWCLVQDLGWFFCCLDLQQKRGSRVCSSHLLVPVPTKKREMDTGRVHDEEWYIPTIYNNILSFSLQMTLLQGIFFPKKDTTRFTSWSWLEVLDFIAPFVATMLSSRFRANAFWVSMRSVWNPWSSHDSARQRGQPVKWVFSGFLFLKSWDHGLYAVKINCYPSDTGTDLYWGISMYAFSTGLRPQSPYANVLTIHVGNVNWSYHWLFQETTAYWLCCVFKRVSNAFWNSD